MADALAQVSTVTVAIVGIGSWSAGESTLFDLATAEERQAMHLAGAVGEISGVFIDGAGMPVEGHLTDRLITLRADQLRGIRHVIGLAVGSARAEVVRAAVTGGYIDALVVDAPLADALL